MLSKLLITIFSILQNQEVTYTVAEEMARAKKVSNLSQLITLLSLTLFTIIILFVIYLYKNYRLRAKIRKLESELN